MTFIKAARKTAAERGTRGIPTHEKGIPATGGGKNVSTPRGGSPSLTGVRSMTLEITQKGLAAFAAKWENESSGAVLDQVEDPDTGRVEIRNIQTASDMLFNYIEDRAALMKERSFRLLGVERPFAVPLDPDRPELIYVGRLDKEIEYDGQVYIVEHKTTTAYTKNGPFRAQFVDSFSPNSQVDGYLYSGHLRHGERLKACWIDAALVHREVHDGFRFIPIERRLQQLTAWVWETLYWVRQIEANTAVAGDGAGSALDYLPAFPKNTSSCSHYEGCHALNLCKMFSNPAAIADPPAGYTEEKWEPFDERLLENAREAGIKISKKTVLFDNTRIASFRTCPRLFYYRHIRDWAPLGDKRALLFGGAWHSAMDTIWPLMARRGIE